MNDIAWMQGAIVFFGLVGGMAIAAMLHSFLHWVGEYVTKKLSDFRYHTPNGRLKALKEVNKRPLRAGRWD